MKMKRKTAIRGSAMKGMKGENIFTDIYDKVIKPTGRFLKDSKIISKVGSALGSVVPIAGTVGRVADAVGLGRKRRKGGRRMRGGAIRGAGAVRF